MHHRFLTGLRHRATIVLGFVIGFSGPAHAQGPLSVDFRVGLAELTHDARDLEVDRGSGLQFTARYTLLGNVSVYAAWSRYRFDAEVNSDVVQSLQIYDKGYATGVGIEPSLLPMLRPWLSAGLTYHNVSTRFSQRSYPAGYDLGWEAAAGVSVRPANWLALNPGVQYRSQAPEQYGDFPTSWDLRYLAGEFGIKIVL